MSTNKFYLRKRSERKKINKKLLFWEGCRSMEIRKADFIRVNGRKQNAHLISMFVTEIVFNLKIRIKKGGSIRGGLLTYQASRVKEGVLH